MRWWALVAPPDRLDGVTFGSRTGRLWGWVNSAEVVSVLMAPGQVIAGWPALELRDLMRRMRDEAYTVFGLAEDLQLTGERALKLISDLVAAGLLELVEHPAVR